MGKKKHYTITMHNTVVYEMGKHPFYLVPYVFGFNTHDAWFEVWKYDTSWTVRRFASYDQAQRTLQTGYQD